MQMKEHTARVRNGLQIRYSDDRMHQISDKIQTKGIFYGSSNKKEQSTPINRTFSA